MTIQELSQAVGLAHKKKIAKALKAQGLVECKKVAELSAITTADLQTAAAEYTEVFADKKGKKKFKGCILKRVRGWEQYTFVAYNQVADEAGESLLVGAPLFAEEIQM